MVVCFHGSLTSAVGKRVSAENLLGSLLRVARYSDVANEGVDLEIKKGVIPMPGYPKVGAKARLRSD